MMLTCPGIASPNEKSMKSMRPVMVVILAIPYAARLAKSKVIATENSETITLFLKGVKTLPS